MLSSGTQRSLPLADLHEQAGMYEKKALSIISGPEIIQGFESHYQFLDLRLEIYRQAAQVFYRQCHMASVKCFCQQAALLQHLHCLQGQSQVQCIAIV